MYLLDKNDKELFKFYVDLGRLFFLGKELRNVSIYTYPIIIFEFMTGYYTTEEIYKKNQQITLSFAQDFEIMEIPKDVQKLKPTLTLFPNRSSNIDNNRESRILNSSKALPPIKESINENVDTKKVIHLSPDRSTYSSISEENKTKLGNADKNQPDYKNSFKSINTIRETEYKSSIKSATIRVPSPLNENSTPKRDKDKLSKSVLVKKKAGIDKKNLNETKAIKSFIIPYFDFIIQYQQLSFFISPENNKENNSEFGKELEIFKEGLEKYKRKIRILLMEKEIEFLTKKNEAIIELNKDLEEAINHKKNNLKKVTNKFEPSQKQYNTKLNLLKNNLKGRGQFQLVYDSFVYQKMVEVCFVFFNSKIKSLYTIPNFYNESISNDTKKLERLEYYNNDKKNISSMMGHICQLVVYLSKIYNIPMRYPIFLNGSRSYILRSLKDKMFLPLYLDTKKEDKHGIFEIALNCLKDDIKEIFNFFAMFPEIISKTDFETINNMNGNYLFFFFFVVFNHSLFRFMKIIQNNA